MKMNEFTKMIAETREVIAEYERAADGLRNVLLGQGYIVCCQGLPLAFDIERRRVSNPRTCAPHLATRFTLDDAANVARDVKNGNDAPGEVVHVRHAIAHCLVEQRELLAQLESHVSKTTSKQS